MKKKSKNPNFCTTTDKVLKILFVIALFFFALALLTYKLDLGEEVTEKETVDDLCPDLNKDFICDDAEENTFSIAVVQCPASCDDGDDCTNDFCSENTNYECVHEMKKGCEVQVVRDEKPKPVENGVAKSSPIDLRLTENIVLGPQEDYGTLNHVSLSIENTARSRVKGEWELIAQWDKDDPHLLYSGKEELGLMPGDLIERAKAVRHVFYDHMTLTLAYYADIWHEEPLAKEVHHYTLMDMKNNK